METYLGGVRYEARPAHGNALKALFRACHDADHAGLIQAASPGRPVRVERHTPSLAFRAVFLSADQRHPVVSRLAPVLDSDASTASDFLRALESLCEPFAQLRSAHATGLEHDPFVQEYLEHLIGVGADFVDRSSMAPYIRSYLREMVGQIADTRSLQGMILRHQRVAYFAAVLGNGLACEDQAAESMSANIGSQAEFDVWRDRAISAMEKESRR